MLQLLLTFMGFITTCMYCKIKLKLNYLWQGHRYQWPNNRWDN